ncbi:dihydrodipicolinate synthase family protein [Streptomyces rapamycinicus]|uniref:dihydrodipicolinate synthase family protein n=1 Tax=Streptomyces rapamycinicus TaxID=1226757 RepID=UPI000EF7FDCD|nr:dihydrodipicolinate synthase family protein [Streptomyces rapamycinicus]UTP31929.1 dihydrodipicolinate synthase family protein [Streptomyces rapamycinicus NRRL 5491]
MNNSNPAPSGSIVAAVTPFHPSGEIDEEVFVEHGGHLLGKGADGVLVEGSTGEVRAPERNEKTRLDQEEKTRLRALDRRRRRPGRPTRPGPQRNPHRRNLGGLPRDPGGRCGRGTGRPAVVRRPHPGGGARALPTQRPRRALPHLPQ